MSEGWAVWPGGYFDGAVVAAPGLWTAAEDVLRALVHLSTYCADVLALGADAGVAQLQLGGSSGVLYLRGGWGQLFAALGAGQQVRTHSAVEALRGQGGRVEVQLGDESLVGRSVVVAVGRPSATPACCLTPPTGVTSDRWRVPRASTSRSTICPYRDTCSVSTGRCTRRCRGHRRVAPRRVPPR